MKKLCFGFLSSLLLAKAAFAITATVNFTDVTGDQSTAGDVTGARLDFDTVTGAYTATWLASGANPFQGDINFNLNLGNQRLFTHATFQSSVTGLAATTSYAYSGTSIALTNWLLGDTIVPAGTNPPYTASFSAGIVDTANSSSRDFLTVSSVVTTPQATVPDGGSALALLTLGLGAIGLLKRSSRRA
jgi:hypothetical protein